MGSSYGHKLAETIAVKIFFVIWLIFVIGFLSHYLWEWIYAHISISIQ